LVVQAGAAGAHRRRGRARRVRRGPQPSRMLQPRQTCTSCGTLPVTIPYRPDHRKVGGHSMADQFVLPRVQALVLCAQIEQRPGEEDLYDLKGVRSELYAPAFPHTPARLCVYLQLTGHEGIAACRVEVLRMATDTVVFDLQDADIDFFGPLDVVHFGVE